MLTLHSIIPLSLALTIENSRRVGMEPDGGVSNLAGPLLAVRSAWPLSTEAKSLIGLGARGNELC